MHNTRCPLTWTLALLMATPALAGAPTVAAPAPVSAAAPQAAQPGAIDVRGDIPKPGPLTLADVMAMGGQTTTWTLHDKSHTVVGVPLEQVLRRVGWDPGIMSKSVAPTEKRVGYKRVVVVTARDGFQAVFSAAELTAGMGKTQVFLAWNVDGKALPPDQGSLRLVVPTDSEPSRSVYQIGRIDVIDMRRIVPTPLAPPAK